MLLSRIRCGAYCRALVVPRRTFSSHLPNSPKQPLASAQLEDIGIIRAYGKPVATIFLWSALTYMTFQAIWSNLYFDEIRLETETKIDSLKTELDRLEKSK